MNGRASIEHCYRGCKLLHATIASGVDMALPTPTRFAEAVKEINEDLVISYYDSGAPEKSGPHKTYVLFSGLAHNKSELDSHVLIPTWLDDAVHAQ